VRAGEARRIVSASSDASTSAFHLGAGLGGALMIVGGLVSAVGIRDPKRRRGGPDDGDEPPGGEPPAEGEDPEGGHKLDLAAHG
jgi:hypothetical protein